MALLPVTNPVVGPARVGAGNQVGIRPETAEITVIDLGERAAVVTAFGEPDEREQWPPQMRSIIDSIRFA